jgi:hypothetical protein
MNDNGILKLALGILGGALLLCLAGIIWLASANPARSIPDVLVATTGLVSGGLVGILVPGAPSPKRRGEVGSSALYFALVAVAVLVALILFVMLLNRV